MPFPCDFCGSILSTKSNLNTHQRKTLKCLEIQNAGKKTVEELRSEQSFKCDYCNHGFMIKRDLSRHLESCKIRAVENGEESLRIIIARLEERILNLENQNLDLKAQLAKKEQNQQIVTLAAVSKPTSSVKNTIKNCTIQNLTPLVEDEMRGHLDNFTIDHVRAGPAGYAKYAMEYPLRDKITCTDSSRRKIAWKDSEGVVVHDADGARLSEKFFRILKDKNQHFFLQIRDSLSDQLQEAYSRDDQVEADIIIELTDKICTWRREATETSRGQDTTLRKEFVKYLCSTGTPKLMEA